MLETRRLLKIGSSVGITLSPGDMAYIGVQAGDVVAVSRAHGRLIVAPISPPPPMPGLAAEPEEVSNVSAS